MSQEWYYAQGNERKGPVSSQHLKGLATSGQLQPSDLVWREGMPEWVNASSIKGLFSDQRQAVPPPLLSAAQARSDASGSKEPSPESSQSPSHSSSEKNASGQQEGTAATEPNWFVQRAGKEDGPYTRKQLQGLASGGQLARNNLVRREMWGGQMGDWKQAQDVWGLFPSADCEPKDGGTADNVEADIASQQPSAPETNSERVSEEQRHAEPVRSEPETCENWYYSQGGKQFGPVTFGRLFDLAASGELKPQDMVAREGAKWWFAGRFLLAFNPAQRPPQISDYDQWYYGSQGRQFGPVPFQQLVALATSGVLQPGHLVGRMGTNWVPAGALLSTVFPQPRQPPQVSLDDPTMWKAIFIGVAFGVLFWLYSGQFLSTIGFGAVGGFLFHFASVRFPAIAGDVSLAKHPRAFIVVLLGYFLVLCVWGPLHREGKKFTAFRALVKTYQSMPSGDLSMNELRKYREKIEKQQEEFFAIPFDSKKSPSEAKKIAELYLDDIYDIYTGQLASDLHDHIEPIWKAVEDDVRLPRRLRQKWEADFQR